MLTYFAILACVAVAFPTGLKGGMTKAMIQDFKVNQLPAIMKDAEHIKIQDQHETIGQGYFRVTVSLTEIKMPVINLDIDKSDLVFIEPDKVQLLVKDLSATGSFKWQYDSVLGGDHGTSEMSISKTDFSITFTLGEKEGRPTLSIPKSELNIGDINIQIHGTPSAKFVNWLAGVYKEKLKKFISEEFVKTMETEINEQLAKSIGSIPLWIEIPNTPLAVNYTLTAPPKVASGHIEISSLGLFVKKDSPNYYPPIAPPQPLPAIQDDGKHLQIWLTEYTINTAFYAAFTAGMLTTRITSEMIPSSSPVQLDTTSLNTILPGLTDKYGKDKKCDITCTASDYPIMTIEAPSLYRKNGQISGSTDSECVITVRGQGDAVALDVKVAYGISVYLEDWKIKGSLEHAEITELEIKENNIGKKIDTEDLKDTLNFFLGLILPYSNLTILGPGIPLPKSEGVDLTDSEAKLGKGYIYIQANPKFSVPVPESP
jgi:hypothetical protein